MRLSSGGIYPAFQAASLEASSSRAVSRHFRSANFSTSSSTASRTSRTTSRKAQSFWRNLRWSTDGQRAGSKRTYAQSRFIPRGSILDTIKAKYGPRTPKIVAWCMAGSLFVHLPLIYYTFWGEENDINPSSYSLRPITEMKRLTPRHKYLEIPVTPEVAESFGDLALGMDGEKLDVEAGAIAIQHINIKSDAIKVERPYTPINDVEADGNMKLVVKRVSGGEVGRVIFALQKGDRIDIRGPITTFAINPYDFDRIVMVSTGTGIAPFLQLLSKIPSPNSPQIPLTPIELDPNTTTASSQTPSNSAAPTPKKIRIADPSRPLPQLHLIHALPPPEKEDTDWPVSLGIFTSLKEKFGSGLDIHRTPFRSIPESTISQALGRSKSFWGGWKAAPKDERVMVIVALPPKMMEELCGTMTPDFQQGPLRGLLMEMDLRQGQVYKLEG